MKRADGNKGPGDLEPAFYSAQGFVRGRAPGLCLWYSSRWGRIRAVPQQHLERPAPAGGAARAFAAAWLALFYLLVFVGATPAPPAAQAFPALALAGLLYGLAFEREALRDLLTEHRLLLGAALALVAGIVAAEGWMAWAGLRRMPGPLPAQVGLFLCLAPLALVLRQHRLQQASALLFAAFCVWHLFALPGEAVLGGRLGWHDMALIPRPWGAYTYQAAGLAWQVYFFPGLFLPLFFMALGLAAQERLWPSVSIPPRVRFGLGLLWAGAVTALQSRSAFAGALAATLLGGMASMPWRTLKTRLQLAFAALAGMTLYWLLFSASKSPAGLRWAYLQLYLQRSLEWPWIVSGRSYSVVADGGMAVPGLEFLPHSHNDLLQVLFSWGLPVLACYGVFWFALLRLAWRDYWRQGRHWPLLAFVAVLPSLVTDLGLHHYEKAAFMVLLAGLCMALAKQRPAALRP
jgi:hypothetical protein